MTRIGTASGHRCRRQLLASALIAVSLLFTGTAAARDRPPATAPPGTTEAPRDEVELSEHLIEDAVISSMIETRLMADEQIDSRELRVETHLGAVVISGRVPDEATANRVMAVAQEVEGVRSVRLELDPRR